MTVREIAIPLVSFVFNTDFIIENIFHHVFEKVLTEKGVEHLNIFLFLKEANYLADEKEQKMKVNLLTDQSFLEFKVSFYLCSTEISLHIGLFQD